jgi:predicted O-methyltransferase YrrM
MTRTANFDERILRMGAPKRSNARRSTNGQTGSHWGHLRLVETPALLEYLENTDLWNRIGNAAFARRIRESDGPALSRSDKGSRFRCDEPYVLYHSWRRGRVPLTRPQAAMVRRLVAGEAPRRPGRGHPAPFLDQIAPSWCEPGSLSIDELVERTYDSFTAIQNIWELTTFLRLVRTMRPKVVVEIGTARGGTFYTLCQVADPAALLVSIDLPGAPNCGGQTEMERRVFRTFAGPGQQVVFIPENSQFYTTRQKLRDALGGKQIDLLFIDGDHSYGGVRCDFEMYGDMVSPTGIIALHDICMVPENWGPGAEVGLFWREIKRSHRTREIIDRGGVVTRARKPSERYAWGIGVVRRGA